MRALSLVGVVAVTVLGGVARAEPKSTPVDIKPFRDQLLVFIDGSGNAYVVKPHKKTDKIDEPERIFFGKNGKELYEQRSVGKTTNGPAWSYQTWAPRVPGIRPAYFMFRDDGSYHKSCDLNDDTVLTQLTGDKAKQLLDKSKLMTEFLLRRPHMLARDDSGVYYYVDKLSERYGGKGYRVFVGRKGAMKQLPLKDVAADTAGEVYATDTGDLRLSRTHNFGDAPVDKIMWVRGEKKTELIPLDVDANSTVIFTDLGIYQFLGTLCDNI